ncbi:hypothetical protein DPMN_009743, partial [Dreissena polymorpha]
RRLYAPPKKTSYGNLKLRYPSRECQLKVKNAPTPGGHVFKPTGINFELVQDIKGIFSRFGKLTKLKKVISDS